MIYIVIYSDLMGYHSDHRKKMDEIYDFFPNDLLMGILFMSLISSTELPAQMAMSWWVSY